MLSALNIIDEFVHVRDGSFDQGVIYVEAEDVLWLEVWGYLKRESADVAPNIKHSFALKQLIRILLAPSNLKALVLRDKKL